MSKNFLGIFVRPIYPQNEGLSQVFDNLESMGVTAICTTPTVSRPGTAGKRFPDLHVDGYERVVARPVWGECELNLETFPAYEPDLNLYEGTPYRPLSGAALPEEDRQLPAMMIAEAKRRGMKAHLQIAPFVPSGMQKEDQPVRIDGSVPEAPQVAMAASLNSPAAQTYALALVEDVVRNYPEIDGLFMDWAEYGAYCLEDLFTCFSPHSEKRARALGFDWDAVRRDTGLLWEKLHHLTSRDLERGHRLLRRPFELMELLLHHPGWLELLRFKASTVVDFYRQARARIDELNMPHIELSARGWPPPWNQLSGMDYRRVSASCAAVTPKLFTFDYSVMPRWYGQTLLDWNPQLAESELLDALVAWMELPDAVEPRNFARYQIPAPGEDHPARPDIYRDRVEEVVDQVGEKVLVLPFAHAYLPEHQWKRMVAQLRDSRVDGMWIQMYGYLSERKMQIVRGMWR